MSEPKVRILGSCVVNGYAMPLIDRMPPGAARVLDVYGRLNRPFSFDAARITVGEVSWRDDYHTMAAVPSERDEAAFPLNYSSDDTGSWGDWCSVWIVPEELPHVMAAARLMRSSG